MGISPTFLLKRDKQRLWLAGCATYPLPSLTEVHRSYMALSILFSSVTPTAQSDTSLNEVAHLQKVLPFQDGRLSIYRFDEGFIGQSLD